MHWCDCHVWRALVDLELLCQLFLLLLELLDLSLHLLEALDLFHVYLSEPIDAISEGFIFLL